MALQYWHGAGRPRKSRLLTVRGGYHGDTFGAMCGLRPGQRHAHLFAGVLARAGFRRPPPAGFERRRTRPDVAGAGPRAGGARRTAGRASIVEPIVQGAGGMRFYNPDYLRVLRDVCDASRCAADLRRDRDRLRAHRQAVRLRARRHRARHPVRRQGADRRLPDVGRDAVHRRRSPTASRAAERGRVHARPDLHGATRWPARWRWRSIDLLLLGDWPARVARIERGCARAGPARDAARGAPTCGCSARSASSSSTAPVDVARATARRWSRGCGCARSAPAVHDAALRHRRRGPGHHRPGAARRGRGRWPDERCRRTLSPPGLAAPPPPQRGSDRAAPAAAPRGTPRTGARPGLERLPGAVRDTRWWSRRPPPRCGAGAPARPAPGW